MRRTSLLALVMPALLVGAAPAWADDDAGNSTRGLQKAVTTQGIDEHLRAFQMHGDLNGGNRA